MQTRLLTFYVFPHLGKTQRLPDADAVCDHTGEVSSTWEWPASMSSELGQVEPPPPPRQEDGAVLETLSNSF